MAAALAVLGVSISVSVAAFEDVFTYVKPDSSRRADDEDCKVCYGENDCLIMNQARCDFYAATSEILLEDDGPEENTNPELRIQVDSLMMGLAEQSNTVLTTEECVPFVSQYSDCTKENIGFGCRTCTCSEGGTWNCSFGQHCTPEEQLDFNHQTLVSAMEILKGEENSLFRRKRSVTTTPVSTPYNIKFEEIAQWMYDVKPLNYDVFANTKEPNSKIGTTESNIGVVTTVNEDISTTENIGINIVEPDYIAFNDVLNNIDIQNKNLTQNRLNTTPLFDDLDHDFKKINDLNVTLEEYNEVRMAEHFVHILNTVGNVDELEVATTTEGVTKVVIDLLELARKRIEKDHNDTDTKVTLLNDTVFDDSNDMYEFNAINVMKRDVSPVTENNINVTVTEKPNDAINSSKELKDGVYLPINAIIMDKQKELTDLLRVKQKLLEILNPNNSTEYAVLNKSEIVENGSNSYISFYNVQIVPQTDYDSKRSAISLLDKYLKKLKQDMYVVIRDIVSIQTITGPDDFPKNLKVLTRAIKHFMRNHTKSHRKNKLESYDISNLRRHLGNTFMPKEFVKNYLINILLIIDENLLGKHLPEGNALAPLSVKTRRILNRVFKNNRLNEIPILGYRVNDPNYNLTNDLKSIGANWQEMTVKISECPPWDRLHTMKLLLFDLETDIGKMKDALALINFAHSRRMVAYQDEVDKDELLRINKNLRSIHNKISDISKIRSLNEPERKIVRIFTIAKQSKKETFLKHIRSLLKSSKSDILKLLRKKVSKSEIVKKLAKKKLNEMTKKKLLEYENVMQKWQNNLDITRKKRSSGFEKLTNILPKYLRGKVSSKMNSTKHKNMSKLKRSERRKSKKNNKKKISVVATTSKNPIGNQLNNKQTQNPKGKKHNKKNKHIAAKTVKTDITNHTNKTRQ